MSSLESVGSLLAAIATLIAQGLRILSLADKNHWGPDEHEQVHALAAALDEAKKDFQELAPLVNGQIYYETDRKCTLSLDVLGMSCWTAQGQLLLRYPCADSPTS